MEVKHYLTYIGDRKVSDESYDILYKFSRIPSESYTQPWLVSDSNNQTLLYIAQAPPDDMTLLVDRVLLNPRRFEVGTRVKVVAPVPPSGTIGLLRLERASSQSWQVVEEINILAGEEYTIRDGEQYILTCRDGNWVDLYCKPYAQQHDGNFSILLMNEGSYHWEYNVEIIKEIDEPIGFDNLETSIERGEFHGMSVEASLGSLEFYGEAYNIIKEAYEKDIDTDVKYKVMAGTETMYSGAIDLSTCEFLQSDYKSVSTKIGEIGAKTVFNSRVDAEVDVETNKTIDGAEMAPAKWETIDIPIVHLKYTNLLEQKADKIYTTFGGAVDDVTGCLILGHWNVAGAPGVYNYLSFPISDHTANEFGAIEELPVPYSARNIVETTGDVTENYTFYYPDEEFVKKYGNNVNCDIDFHIAAKLVAHGWHSPRLSGIKYYAVVVGISGLDIRVLKSNEYIFNEPTSDPSSHDIDLDFSVIGTLPASMNIYWRLCVEFPGEQYYTPFDSVTIKSGSHLRMTMYDNIVYKPTPTKMVTVHDALNAISRAISENAILVKSDYYGQEDSQYYPTTRAGAGAYRMLTNGYKIRDLFTEGSIKRNMPISFKTIMESINMIDCAGWGFSRENGADVVRVEPWPWFYKNDSIVSFENVAEIKWSVDANNIPTSLVIGFKKYETSDAFNSIDSIHGERSFTSAIKATNKEIKAECEFVADNYALELTRRERFSADITKESAYDENIFIIQCYRPGGVYEVDQGVDGAFGIDRPRELINFEISPRMCAERWAGLLFPSTSKSGMRLTSGTINYNAEWWLGDESVYEDADIPYQHAKFRAETLSFECPVSIAQYKAIKANPYGLVEVNGVQGWIKSFKYKFNDGMGEFKLIPKYEE